MRITCTTALMGCGTKFELTDDLLVEFRRAAEAGENTGCPNPDCVRVITPSHIRQLLDIIDDQPPWPGFPLKTPVVPEGRRKGGAQPGICFKKISEKELDRPPTSEEILRVQRFFADNLDGGGDCPCCTRYAKRQHRSMGSGPARWLIELVYLSDKGQAIHTGEVIKALKGNNVSGADATSVLPLYGLIEPAEDPNSGTNPPPPSSRAHAKGRTPGFWRPTKLGRSFALDRVKVPERIVTCLGVPEAFEGGSVSIKEALGKKFNYDAIMCRGAKP